MAIAISPGVLWDGTAATGYDGSPPADPARTGPKAIISLFTPPHQRFADDLPLWFCADALGGIDKLTVYCEGSTADAVSPEKVTYTDTNGGSRTIWAYVVTLDHSAFSTDGDVDVYAEAVPTSGAVQHRIIGPFRFTRAASVFDVEVLVTPSTGTSGSSPFDTIANALAWCKNNSKTAPHIICTEAGDYTIASLASNYVPTNWATITASAAIVFTAAASIRPKADKLKLSGENITIDLLNNITWYAENGYYVWLDGINVINSDGRNALYDGTPPVSVWTRSGVDTAFYYATECSVIGTYNGLCNFKSVRNCDHESLSSDALQNTLNVYGCTVNDQSAAGLRNEVSALTIRYSGAEATATVTKNGSNNSTTGTLVLAAGGSTVLTVTLNSTVQAVADEINTTLGASGWTATVIDDTRRSAAISKTGSVGAFTATDCKTAPITLITVFDIHADLIQMFGTIENVCIANVRGTSLVEVQSVFLDKTSSTFKDVSIRNVLAINTTTSGGSQLCSAQDHVLIRHCTVLGQAFLLRSDLSTTSEYSPTNSLIENGLFESMAWTSETKAGVSIDRCQFIDSPVPDGATNSDSGTALESLVDGSYVPLPASDLLGAANAGTAWDLSDSARGVASDIGAYELLNTAPTATITSAATQTAVEGDTVTLTGTGTDDEDGPLTGAVLAWSSDIDGALGTGTSLEVSDLGVGEHTITLTVTDSGGLTDTDTCTVTINAKTAPVLTTAAVTGTTYVAAICGGTISSDGGEAVTARGVCWNTTGTPTIADSKTSDGTGTGTFASIVRPLERVTAYYVRAYATNSIGTGYGVTAAFVTPDFQSYSVRRHRVDWNADDEGEV